MTDFAIVSTTVASDAEAKSLARALVEARLAACVQILPVESVYRWKGAIETAPEYRLACKILAADFPAVSAAIGALHSYDVPEIVLTKIEAGNASYIGWLADETSRPRDPT